MLQGGYDNTALIWASPTYTCYNSTYKISIKFVTHYFNFLNLLEDVLGLTSDITYRRVVTRTTFEDDAGIGAGVLCRVVVVLVINGYFAVISQWQVGFIS